MLRLLFLGSILISSGTSRIIICSRLSRFRTNTTVTFSKSQTNLEEFDRLTTWPLQMRPACCPETSTSQHPRRLKTSNTERLKPENGRVAWKAGPCIFSQGPFDTTSTYRKKLGIKHEIRKQDFKLVSRSLMLSWFDCHIAFLPSTFVEIVVTMKPNTHKR
jgi:hypothetical protein